MRYAASLENVMVVLSGMSTPEQVADNVAYMQDFQPLNEEEYALVEQAAEITRKSITIGCTVTVVDLKTGREMPPYKVVGSQEADPMHRAISEESPFGKALMGAKEGDEISVEAPVGIIHYRVEKIER